MGNQRHHKHIRKIHQAALRRLTAHHKRASGALVRKAYKVLNKRSNFISGATWKRRAVRKAMPAKPSGMTKQASGFFDFIKSGWGKVKKMFGAGKKHLTKKAKEAYKHVKAEVIKEGKSALRKGIKYAAKSGEDVITGKKTLKQVGRQAVSGAKAHVQNRITHHKAAFKKSVDSHVANYKAMAVKKLQEVAGREN